MWSDEAYAKLQDCFASTDWNMFWDSSDGIEKYTTSVTGFICHGRLPRRNKWTQVQRGQLTFLFLFKMSPTKQETKNNREAYKVNYPH